MRFDLRTPERHSELEHVLFRGAYAWLAWYYDTSVRVYKGQPTPNGLAQYVDLTFMANPDVVPVLRIVLAVSLLLYTFGRWPILTLGYACAFQVALDTLKNSQGAIGHSGQLVCVAGIALWLAYVSQPLLERWKLVATRDVRDVAIHYAKQITAGCYVVAGVTKLIRSKGEWLMDSPDLASSIAKANEQEFYNSLTPGLLDYSNALSEWVIGNPWLVRGLFGSALLLELGSFVALGSRRLAFLVGVSLMLMHEGIRQTMSLNFRFNVLVILIFFVQLPCIVAWVYGEQVHPRLPAPLRARLESLAGKLFGVSRAGGAALPDG